MIEKVWPSNSQPGLSMVNTQYASKISSDQAIPKTNEMRISVSGSQASVVSKDLQMILKCNQV